MKYEDYPVLETPLEINGEIYDQEKLDSMDLHHVWNLHGILGKECGLANERWMYQLKGNEQTIYRRNAEAGIQYEFQVIKDYYWNRPEHEDLDFVYRSSTGAFGGNNVSFHGRHSCSSSSLS